MGLITAIVPDRKDPTRTIIKVDGRSVATVSQASIRELGIRENQPWDTQLAVQVAEAAKVDCAHRAAMQRLNRRALTTAQLASKLYRLGYAAATVQRVCRGLQQIGALDDEAFGRSLIRELQDRKPAGPRLLRQKLLQRGIEQSLIDRLIAESLDTADPRTTAIELARRKLPLLERHDPKTRKKRLWGMLQRRGFDEETIQEVLEEVGNSCS